MRAGIGRGFRLGRIVGIPIFLDSSWFLVFALITYSLAAQLASEHPGWPTNERWAVGVITSLLFFASVLFHELGHSMVALHYRIPVVSITLFVFGGLARIGREPEKALQEFNIAIAGPIASFCLSGGFFLIGRATSHSEMIAATADWLATINFTLAAFNLVPGFPLDGGRILRSIAWGISKDFSRATKIASRGGEIFAYLIMLAGIWNGINKNVIGGLWLVFIGWFLLSAARESYAQVATRSSLEGLRAGDVMTHEVPTVARDISIEDYIHEVLRTGRRCHFVTDNGELVGLMTPHAAGRVPRDEWASTSVQAAMLRRDQIHWAELEEPLLRVLERMQSEDINQMPVIDNGNIVGLLSRDSILRVIQTRVRVERLAEQ